LKNIHEISLKHFIHAKKIKFTKENVLTETFSAFFPIDFHLTNAETFFQISSLEEKKSETYRFGTTNSDIHDRSIIKNNNNNTFFFSKDALT